MKSVKFLTPLILTVFLILLSDKSIAKQNHIVTQAMYNLLKPISRDNEPNLYRRYCDKGKGITTLPKVTFQQNYPKVPRSSNSTYWDKKLDYFIQNPGTTKCQIWQRK